MTGVPRICLCSRSSKVLCFLPPGFACSRRADDGECIWLSYAGQNRWSDLEHHLRNVIGSSQPSKSSRHDGNCIEKENADRLELRTGHSVGPPEHGPIPFKPFEPSEPAQIPMECLCLGKTCPQKSIPISCPRAAWGSGRLEKFSEGLGPRLPSKPTRDGKKKGIAGAMVQTMSFGSCSFKNASNTLITHPQAHSPVSVGYSPNLISSAGCGRATAYEEACSPPVKRSRESTDTSISIVPEPRFSPVAKTKYRKAQKPSKTHSSPPSAVGPFSLRPFSPTWSRGAARRRDHAARSTEIDSKLGCKLSTAQLEK